MTMKQCTEKIPIIFGITGHRDIFPQHESVIQEMIQKIFQDQKSKYPHTPLILLTPLAEGADRIAARAMLSIGGSIIVPLPLSKEEYKKDFKTNESLMEFNDLLSQAMETFVVPEQKFTRSSSKRNIQYASAGAYVVKYSNALIAVWDGTESGKFGGTSFVVNMKIQGSETNEEIALGKLVQQQTGPVYHILTPRITNGDKWDSISLRMLYPSFWGDDKLAASYEATIYERVESYNTDYDSLNEKLQRKILSTQKFLLKDEESTESSVLSTIARIHGIADQLSIYFQKKRFFALKVLLSMVVLAFAFFQVYAELGGILLFLVLYPITISLGAGWFYYARKNKYENKHEDYRALSEAMRVQFYLTSAGINENIADHYLQKHKGELEWILYTLRTWMMFVQIQAQKARPIKASVEQIKKVRQEWIIGQAKYFTTKSKQNHHKLEVIEHRGNLLFFSAMGSVVVLFLLTMAAHYFGGKVENIIEKTLHPSFIVMTHLSLILSAAVHGYVEKMVFAEQAKQYQRMAQMLHLANNHLKKKLEMSDLKGSILLLISLAKEALMENADWLLMHRSRPMELPKG